MSQRVDVLSYELRLQNMHPLTIFDKMQQYCGIDRSKLSGWDVKQDVKNYVLSAFAKKGERALANVTIAPTRGDGE